MPPEETPSLHPPGTHLLLVDEKDRQYLIQVPDPLLKVRLKGELLDHPTLANLHDGQLLVTAQRRHYLVFLPTLEQVVFNMPRQAQVIFPKDLALLLFYGDVAPGMTIIEVGTGHGALTMSLLRALGSEGRLISFDVRRDHLNRTKKNVAAYLGEELLKRWEPVMANPVAEGFGDYTCDRLFSDIPEPWSLVPGAAQAVRPGGIWAAYLPTAMQLMRQMEALQNERAFCLPSAFEAMQRYWQVRPPSVRPSHAMRGHTGFIVLGRRRWLPPPPE